MTYKLAKGVIDKIIDGSLDGAEYTEFRKVLVGDDKQWAALKAKLVDGVTYETGIAKIISSTIPIVKMLERDVQGPKRKMLKKE